MKKKSLQQLRLGAEHGNKEVPFNVKPPMA